MAKAMPFSCAASADSDGPHARNIFERFRGKTFLPANKAYRDDTRKDFDRAVLMELLQFPEVVLEPLSILRDQ